MRSHEHVERAVTGIFQALPNFCQDGQTNRRTNTMFAAAICRCRPPLPSRDLDFKTWSCPSVEVLKPRSAPGRADRWTDTILALIYKIARSQLHCRSKRMEEPHPSLPAPAFSLPCTISEFQFILQDLHYFISSP